MVVRTDDLGVTAFQNACRHRGVKVADARGTCESGFTCPFHGWCYSPDGKNTFVSKRSSFSEHNLRPEDLDLRPVRCETWGGCAWINLDDDAPPLRSCVEPFATVMDAWKLEALHPEWWVKVRLPVNWKLAEEAFMEQYHVIESHPQLVIPDRYPPKDPAAFDVQTWLDGELHYLRTMSEGMAGMVHASDVRIAEGLRDTIELPAEPGPAVEAWHRAFNDAVTRWHRDQGHAVPDVNELEDRGVNESMGYCFPHFFVLPMYSSASSYRFRPLGPEETLTFADVAEGVRATIAAYTQALDDGRTDDVVATFCPDAVCDFGGMGTFEGHDALRAAYASWAPRGPQRHLVLTP